MADALTVLAMQALFELCVPGASQGRMEKTFPSDLLQPLTTDEAKAIQPKGAEPDTEEYRVASKDGFILLDVTDRHCAVTTGRGNTDAAAAAFRSSLDSAGGHEVHLAAPGKGLTQINGEIPEDKGDAIVLVFSAESGTENGFYGSAFSVHKD
jgi:hypothetical protein